MSADEFAVLDLIVFGSRTMTEAAKELGIPRMTANDRYTNAVALIRRVAKNDPAARAAFEALRELFGDE